MKNMFADFSQITSAKLSVSDSEKQPEGLTSLKKRRERRGKERREEKRRGEEKGKEKGKPQQNIKNPLAISCCIELHISMRIC